MTKTLWRFLIAGSLTVLVDLTSYRLLLWGSVPTAPAKAAGFLIGTLFAYAINKQWTFEASAHSHRAFAPFMVLYSTSLGANVWINSWVLQWLPAGELALWVAFLLATGVSATVNFVGMRHLVFR